MLVQRRNYGVVLCDAGHSSVATAQYDGDPEQAVAGSKAGRDVEHESETERAHAYHLGAGNGRPNDLTSVTSFGPGPITYTLIPRLVGSVGLLDQYQCRMIR